MHSPIILQVVGHETFLLHYNAARTWELVLLEDQKQESLSLTYLMQEIQVSHTFWMLKQEEPDIMILSLPLLGHHHVSLPPRTSQWTTIQKCCHGISFGMLYNLFCME